MSDFKPLRAAVLAALCLAVAGQAAAAETVNGYKVYRVYSIDLAQSMRKTRVKLGDLNLASAEGQLAMRARIDGAAEAVCGGPSNARSKAGRADYEACRTDAVAGALGRVRRAGGLDPSLAR